MFTSGTERLELNRGASRSNKGKTSSDSNCPLTGFEIARLSVSSDVPRCQWSILRICPNTRCNRQSDHKDGKHKHGLARSEIRRARMQYACLWRGPAQDKWQNSF